MDASDVLELIDEGLDLVHEVEEKCPDFAISVYEKLNDMANWIDEHDYASDDQIIAIENMVDGLRKWIDH